jgi:hypothetical protein
VRDSDDVGGGEEDGETSDVAAIDVFGAGEGDGEG